ncbi:MAG: transposase, partial [Candidatus Bipolaricaulota bacterium]|nr:transposase [Candidatus Bipolaricaulota bacterium]
MYATGNSTGAALQLEVFQAHLHSTAPGGALLPQAGRYLPRARKHDTQIAPRLTERNLERFETLVADKGYDDQSYRNRLRSRGKRLKHREFKPADIAANARMDATLSHRRSLVETGISVLKRTYGDAVSSRVGW